MKIEIRSPLVIEKTLRTENLIETVKRHTEKDLAPKVRFANRVRMRLAKELEKAAEALIKEDKQ